MTHEPEVIVQCKVCGLSHLVRDGEEGKAEYWAFVRDHYHDLKPDGSEGHRVFVERAPGVTPRREAS